MAYPAAVRTYWASRLGTCAAVRDRTFNPRTLEDGQIGAVVGHRFVTHEKEGVMQTFIELAYLEGNHGIVEIGKSFSHLHTHTHTNAQLTVVCASIR